jgi:hypothetical protein
MKRIFTQDKGTFEVTERGDDFLKGTVSVSRLGVFDYFVDGKLVKKAKLPEDLFSRATQDTLHLAPVTNTHPRDANGNPVLVDKFNAGDLIKGTISNPRIDGDKLVADEIIYDAKLIEEVADGSKSEVSIGFTFEEEEKSSAYGDQQYDAVQRNIGINHVAHEEAGRAGPECRFHIDMKEEGIMPKWRTRDQKEIAIDGDNASVIHGELTHYKSAATDAESKLTTAEEDAKEQQKQIDKLEKDLADAKKPPAVTGDEKEVVAKLEGDVKTLKEKLELAADEKKTLEKDLKKANDAKPEKVQSIVDARVKLQADAKAFGIDDCGGMSDRQVMEQVIAESDLAYDDGVKVSEKSDDAIADRFESAVERKRQALNSNDGPDGGQVVEGDVKKEMDDNKKGRGSMHSSRQTAKKGGKE